MSVLFGPSSYFDRFGPKVSAVVTGDRDLKKYYPGEKVRGTVRLKTLRLTAFECILKTRVLKFSKKFKPTLLNRQMIYIF